MLTGQILSMHVTTQKQVNNIEWGGWRYSTNGIAQHMKSLENAEFMKSLKAPATELEVLRSKIAALIHIQKLGIELNEEELAAIESFSEDL